MNQLLIQQNFKCALSGLDLHNCIINNKIDRLASIDRKDPKYGYTKNNVQWVHKNINKFKHINSDRSFLKWCNDIYNTKNNRLLLDLNQIKSTILDDTTNNLSEHYNNIQRDACRRNIAFNLSLDFIRKLLQYQNFQCILSKRPIYIKRYKPRDITASLDRIDSSKDYTENNVQWVHKDVNRMKSNLTILEMDYYIEKIYEYNIINNK